MADTNRVSNASWKLAIPCLNTALKRMLRYLHSMADRGIIVFNTDHRALHPFSDADWAGDKDDYLSTTSYLLYLVFHLFPSLTLRVSYISTEDQLADVLTKPLLRHQFVKLVSKLGLSSPVSCL
ncbi:hypothetical protein V2J09_015426 [Rumex salicifolius]